MPYFNTWNVNESLLEEVERVKKIRNISLELDVLGKVAPHIEDTVQVHPKKKFKNWVKHIRKELRLNLKIKK